VSGSKRNHPHKAVLHVYERQSVKQGRYVPPLYFFASEVMTYRIFILERTRGNLRKEAKYLAALAEYYGLRFATFCPRCGYWLFLSDSVISSRRCLHCGSPVIAVIDLKAFLKEMQNCSYGKL